MCAQQGSWGAGWACEHLWHSLLTLPSLHEFMVSISESPLFLAPCWEFQILSLLFHMLMQLGSLPGQRSKRKESDTKLLPTLQDDGFLSPILLLERKPFLPQSTDSAEHECSHLES